MFKEIKDCDQACQYKIIDDDFEEIIDEFKFASGIGKHICYIYNKRNLPVAPNLIRAMLWYKNKYNLSLDQQVYLNKKYNPHWHEVEQDIKKYLLFS